MPLSTSELHSRCKELIDGADQLASDAQRLIRWRAIVHAIATLGATVLLISLADIWLRREEQGLRLLGFAVVWGAAITAYIRILRPAWRFSASRAQVASWATHHAAAAPLQLVETIQLAELYEHELDPTSLQSLAKQTPYGSPGFLRAALQLWFEQNKPPTWRSYLDTASWWRHILLLAVIGIGFAVAFFAAPSVMTQAIARLANPISALPWPLADELQLLRPPAVVAFGETVQLEIIDTRPPLPGRVDVLVRSANASETAEPVQSIPATQIGDVAIANMRPLTQAVEVCAVGGKHVSGRWHRIDVIRPPELEDYEFEILPPDYTQLPSERVSGRRIGVIAGSRVRLAGTFASKLSDFAAQFQFAARATETPHVSDDWQSQWKSSLDDSGRRFAVGTAAGLPTEVHASMRWQFVVATRDGLKVRLPEIWSIEAKPDQPPSLSVASARLSSVALGGQVKVTGLAKDDFGVARLELIIASEGVESRKLLAEHVDAFNFKNAPFTHTFDIAELIDDSKLEYGQTLEVFVAATDAIGQTTRANYQKLTIREPAAILSEVATEQTGIAQQLSDIVRLQNDNALRLDRATTHIKSNRELDQSDALELESIAQTQAEVLRQLSDSEVGIGNRVDQALESLQLNGLANRQVPPDPLSQQLSDLRKSVSSLSQGIAVTAADRASQIAATVARNIAENRGTDRQVERQIETAQLSSQELLRGLERLQDRVAASQARRQLSSDLQDVLDQQRILRRETDGLQIESIDRDQAEVYQQRLRQLSLDQSSLADTLQSLVDRADRLVNQPSEGPDMDQSQLLEAEALGRAAKRVRDAATASEMRQASDRLRSENFADAATNQSSAIESLEQALGAGKTGKNSFAAELEQLADQARDQTQQLRDLASKQTQLSEEITRSASDADARGQLADRQTSLAQATDSLEQRAISAGHGELANRLASASQLQRTAAQLASNDPASASDSAIEAAKLLERSADWLENRAEALAEQLRRQQSLGLQEQLQLLASEQAKILRFIQATSDDDDVRQSAIELTQALRAQQQSATRTRQTIDQLPTFVWALEQVDRSLSRATAAAERQRLRPEAEEAAREALRLLERAASAIASDDDGNTDASGGGSRAESDDSRAAERQPPLASLKLLRALQADVHRETLRLQAVPASTERSRGLAELATQQEALGQQLGKLLESSKR